MRICIYKSWIVFFVVTLLYSCNNQVDNLSSDTLFTKVPTEITGVTFENKILESEQLHYYKYLYIYIGGGVAAADFNNDGLEDLFFTSNIYHNKLFLNKGNFQFEDITIKSGIKKRAGFDTGVSVVDINNDGFLDIYINRAGWYEGDQKLANMLYINNGDLTFTEQAKLYGLADTNRSIASTFFDYDKDGDLDVYIANAPAEFDLSGKIIDINKIQSSKKTQFFRSSDRLYNNDGKGNFTDVSIQVGILPDLGFGLNAQVGDLNNDGWLDIYVSNDFIGPDFAYINNKNGTFSEKRNSLFKHISYYSMGSDIGDINNDGFNDIMVLDMSPEDHIRSKTTMSMMSIDRFNHMVKNDHHHQYMHNVMQLNNKNGSFSEIAHLSGLAQTDWSWSVLFADFDLDGFNDIYVTNGIYRDVVDRDMNIEINNTINDKRNTLKEKDFYQFTQKLPQQKLTNYLFKNKGNLQFDNITKDWSDEKPTFSNGAVYVDLDNDGDLDIVTNNLDENATILRNNARKINTNNFLQFTFKGPKENIFGVGTTVKIYQNDGEILTRQLINSRGYLSSMSNTLHFGLGKHTSVPKIEIIWSDGNKQYFTNTKANQLLRIDYAKSSKTTEQNTNTKSNTIFTETLLDFEHTEIPFNDFDKQLLLPHKLSQTGPAIAKTDLNNDGLEDLFIGGAHNQTAQLLVATQDGNFKNIPVPGFIKDSIYEDVSATFFDADNDGDQDLYVVSGSYEFDPNSQLLQDRLYVNKGDYNFNRSESKLPPIYTAGSIVKASDFDQDGDIDLFIGSRVIPGKYPYAPTSYLLINKDGNFIDKTDDLAPDLKNVGMVTSAEWNDIDNDNDLDLVVTGEWMGIEVFSNDKGILSRKEMYNDLSLTKGWWNKILVVDIDKDGDKDIIAGNLGLNFKHKASKEKPFHVYTNDFDNNGTEDIMLAKYYKSKQVPVRGKHCTAEQIPYLKERIKTYNDFANSDIQEILGETFQSAIHYQATEFRSGIFINNNVSFEFTPFPPEAQMSPINSILYEDFDGDQIKDLLMAGNNYHTEVETTRADAGIGVYLKGSSKKEFKPVKNAETGFYVDKDVRNMLLITSRKKKKVIVINNNSKHQLYEVN
ncbi:RNA-binding protein [Aquimarina atlantica]|uniref:RNA-binding protein n=1 Tax=Aquimarina atlantica TaxID=1317122 RepID=A0A023BX47_9FLAO|nr:VCBS repeat-containing protein [Aquimarina atlantica]EZH74621.1 RNA-binding protein [Aquimarina atlantica]